MEKVQNAISWFEIPVLDFERAKRFYGRIFDYEMPEMPMGGGRIGILLYDAEKGGAGGAIVAAKGYVPSLDRGCLVYLNGGRDLKVVLDRIVGAGGKLIQAKTAIEGMGHYAFFADSEGNKMGLFSPE